MATPTTEEIRQVADAYQTGIGREAAAVVGLPLAQFDEDYLGLCAAHLIKKVRINVRLAGGPPHARRGREAAAIAQKAADLLRRIEDFEREAELVSHYVGNVPLEAAEDLERKKHAAESEEIRKALALVGRKYFQAARQAEGDSLWMRGFASLIASMASVFQTIYGIEAGYTRNPETDEYEGPFIRFARFILEQGGAEASGAAISKAVSRAKKS